MSITPLTSEPASIYAGDTISWKIALPDYPASSGWTLNYNALGAAGRFALSSTPDGADHVIAADKTTTAGYPAGTYTLVKFVDNGTEVVTLAERELIVKPALSSTSAAYDNRSHVKKVLDAIEAVLEGRATSDQLRVKLGDKEIDKHPVADLLKLRSVYFNYYRQEKAALDLSQGIGSGSGKIRVRL